MENTRKVEKEKKSELMIAALCYKEKVISNVQYNSCKMRLVSSMFETLACCSNTSRQEKLLILSCLLIDLISPATIRTHAARCGTITTIVRRIS